MKNPALIVNKAKCGICNQWIVEESFWKCHQYTCRYCLICNRSWTLKPARVRSLEPDEEKKLRDEEYRKFHVCDGPRKYKKNQLLQKEKRLQEEDFQTVESEKVREKDIICEEWRASDPVKEQLKKSTEKIYFADIEAFVNKEKEDTYTPYALGIMERNWKEPKIFYGVDCMKDFLDFCTKLKGRSFLL